LEGPFDSLKVGTKVIVTVKNGMYKFDIKDNFQNIEGPIKGEEESIQKL
jgi:sortase (surface protein transpeptidase)